MALDKKQPIFEKRWIIIFSFIGVFIVGFGTYFLFIALKYQSCKTEIDKLSSLGQYLSGSLGLLLTLATVIGLIVAFMAQKKQIDIQNEEIKSNDTNNKIESFENNFFQLLNLLQSITNNTEFIDFEYEAGDIFSKDFSGPKKRYFVLRSKEVYKKLTTIFYEEYLGKNDSLSTVYNTAKSQNEFNQNFSENISPIFKSFLNNNSSILPHYFRTLYHILKLIYKKQQEIPSLEGKFYSNILRAQLSDNELKLIFFNGISEIANYNSQNLNFKNLIEEFHFFEHLDKNFFKDYPLLINMYNETAYT